MGEQPFRVDGDTIVTDELGIGTTTGAITSYRTSSNSFTSSDAYLSSGAQLQDKVDVGAPAGPSIKMASAYNNNISSYTKRVWIPEEQANYSNANYASIQNRAEAFPVYVPTKMTIRGGKTTIKAYGGATSGSHIYTCFYSVSGYSANEAYMNWPRALQGYVKFTHPSLSQNAWSNVMHYGDDGDDGIIYSKNRANRTGFTLDKGHYWVVVRQDSDMYTGSDPSSDTKTGLRSSSEFHWAPSSMRSPWGIGGNGNIRLLTCTSANWQPVSNANFAVPTEITSTDWNYYLNTDGWVGLWTPHLEYYYNKTGIVNAVDTILTSGSGTSSTARNDCLTTTLGSGEGLTVDLTYSSNNLTGVAVNCGGSGYSDNDVCTIATSTDRNGYSSISFSVNGVTA